jgi:DNA polymerase-4
MFARTVVLKLRYSNFETITRSETREPSTRDAGEIRGRAAALLEKTEAGRRPVRLLGVSLHGLSSETASAREEPEQFPFPTDAPKA